MVSPEKALRTAIIKLIYKKPEFRDALLPILKKAGLITVDTTLDLDKSKTRVRREIDTIILWELVHAGKRGKWVRVLTLSDLKYNEDRDGDLIIAWVDSLDEMASFEDILLSAQELEKNLVGNSMRMKVEATKSFDVAPFGYGPIEIEGKDVKIVSSWGDFLVKDLQQYRFRSCTPATRGGKRSIKKFYEWVLENKQDICVMCFDEIRTEMRTEGIKHHYNYYGKRLTE